MGIFIGGNFLGAIFQGAIFTEPRVINNANKEYYFGATLISSRMFNVARNNNKVDSIETGRIAIAYLFPWSDLGKYMNGTFFFDY